MEHPSRTSSAVVAVLALIFTIPAFAQGAEEVLWRFDTEG